MNIETIFHSVEQIEREIKEVYQYFFEYFYDHTGYRELWEGMLEGEGAQIDMIDRCRAIISSTPHPVLETIGRDVNYRELLAIIENYQKEIKEDLDINRALKIAFHLEVLEIQGIFNEMIKLPQEPYFEILSGLHLEIRRNMGRLIDGVERFSTDKDFLYRVLELKGEIVEKRSGTDRRAGSTEFGGSDRRGADRRQGRLVKIICKI
jgi:hypothetical protein